MQILISAAIVTGVQHCDNAAFRGNSPGGPMVGQQRIALVIGNSRYQHAPLSNPVKDAALITARLRALEFEIVGGVSDNPDDRTGSPGANLNFMEMNVLLATFMGKLEPGGTAVIYYAGHGLQVADQNCLVPVDASLSEDQPDLGLVKIRDKIATIIGKLGGDGTLAVFLDACRNDPLDPDQKLRLLGILQRTEPAEQGGRGLGAPGQGSFASFKMPPHANCGRTFIAFATAPGDVAMDGAEGNSPFALALDRHLGVRGLEIEEFYDRVSLDVLDDVARANKGKVQDPWSESNLNRRLFLHPRSGWPIIALGLAGLLAGLVICLAIFENGRLIDPTGRPWIWSLGLLFGLAAAAGTWFWGSGRISDTFLAFAGPGFGFALALAVLKLLPDVATANVKFSPGPSAALAKDVFIGVTIAGGLLYFLGTAIVWWENAPERPQNPLQWLNRILTWSLPLIIVLALLKLQSYVSATNPLDSVKALFTVVGGIIYAISVALSCRGQRGNFSQFGPMTGAITVGMMMPTIFAAYAAVSGRNDISPADGQWLLVTLGALWHLLLGAQLGYCFTYYVPDHKRRN